jgi:hypothetical protein
MFQKRLTWFWILLGLLTLVIIARLVQIQVLDAARYNELAARILTQRPEYTPARRGTIFDRLDRPLLSDEPTSDICIHYGVVVGRDEYLLSVARALRRRGDFPADLTLRDWPARAPTSSASATPCRSARPTSTASPRKINCCRSSRT